MFNSPFPPGSLGHSRTGNPRRPQTQEADPSQFGALRASLLYCPSCKTATPARERLLLVLPTGNLYEYLCSQCGTATGEKTDQDKPDTQLFIP
jgi:hypothetical protein